MTIEGDSIRNNMLRFIRDYITQNGYAPCIRDIANAFHASTSHVDYHLVKLESEGKIKRTYGIARSIVVVHEG